MKNNKHDAEIRIKHCSVQEDGSQIFYYNTPGFFSFIKKNVFPEETSFCITDHWHDELEFAYCTRGSMLYVVEGETLLLNEGQGIFINSRKLHVAISDHDKPCTFICCILHPMLLCSSKFVDKNYVEPIIRNSSVKYMFLDSKVDWQKRILDQIQEMYQDTLGDFSELRVQSRLFDIWQYIYKQGKETVKENVKSNHHLNTLKDMITYIQQHYQEKITLEDVSAAGNVGKTMCTKLFATYVNRTPFEFLKDYRIEQSIVLLKNTDLTITDISYETGFSSPSYFGECFRSSMGCAPLEYRKNLPKQ